MEYIDLRTVPDPEFKEALEEMMATKGWLYFCSELYAISEQVNNLQDINSMEELFEARGQLKAIGLVLNYKDIIDRTEES